MFLVWSAGYSSHYTTTTSQHTDCKQVNRGAALVKSQCNEAVLSVSVSWNSSSSERLRPARPRGTLFSGVRKRRDKLERYSTTIKQLQGPQLCSYTPLVSHISLLLSFMWGFALLAFGTSLSWPHSLEHTPPRMPSHTSLPPQTKQLGSSWNRTSR